MPNPPASDRASFQLHSFLRRERETILEEWARLGRQHLASVQKLSKDEVRNNIPHILDAIADQAEKTIGTEHIAKLPSIGPENHALQRWHLGFSLEEVTREYGLLRKVILQKLAADDVKLSSGHLVFINGALDEAIIEGVVTYVNSANKVLEDERERLQVTLVGIGDGVVSSDARGRVNYLNPAAEEMLGWQGSEAIGRPASEVLIAVDETTRQRLASLDQVAAKADDLSRHSSDILMQRRDGKLFPAEEIAAPLRSSGGDFLGVVTTFRDVSRVRTLTSQLSHLATHDPLTGLPNRTLLIDRLNQELAHARRDDGRLALLYLDLDLFKDVNDMFGHGAGDELLKQVAERLLECTRRSDTVCRLGGDEFVILLTEFNSIDCLSEFGLKITRRLSAPYTVRADTLEISTSVGVSVFPEDGDSADALIKHADIAMYQAKALGRNNVQFFKPNMNKRANELRKLQGDLRKAVLSNQLSLHYQPQIELSSGLIIGAEALLRWHHPQLGLISPKRFIPVAEGHKDTMIHIGNWVLEQACRQSRAWLDAGHAPCRVSVNVSIVQLRYDSILDHVDEILERFQLSPDQLQLELTESLLVSEVQGAADRIRALEKRGVRIAVDDFGTGYSSLSYLKDLPVDELKIDQSFVHGIGKSQDKAAIVQAVIRMGESLKLRVVAEGVEDRDAVEFLIANGCEGAQGHYYSRAIAADAFERQFLSGRPVS